MTSERKVYILDTTLPIKVKEKKVDTVVSNTLSCSVQLRLCLETSVCFSVAAMDTQNRTPRKLLSLCKATPSGFVRQEKVKMVLELNIYTVSGGFWS